MAGIYFHIPFCKQACHYCNFFFTTSLNRIDITKEALIHELQLRYEYLGSEEIETIYFGGGTPSMLEVSFIQKLIDEVYLLYPVSSNVEITLEANPDNLSEEYLDALRDSEVNRLSIGVQSFYEDELQWMNRAHSKKEAENCLKWAKKYGFEYINADLIFGIPGSNKNRFSSNMERMVDYGVDHLSCYALTVEDGTALHHHIKKGRSQAPKDKETEEQFYMAHDYLGDQGYRHYEISNYALAGCESKHNSAYWTGKSYLGIGPGAHSFNGNSRSWNISNMSQYLDGVRKDKPLIETEILSDTDRYNEYVMTAIRMEEGIMMDKLKASFSDKIGYFNETIMEVPSRYIERDDHRVKLSRDGLIFADFVGSLLFWV